MVVGLLLCGLFAVGILAGAALALALNDLGVL